MQICVTRPQCVKIIRGQWEINEWLQSTGRKILRGENQKPKHGLSTVLIQVLNLRGQQLTTLALAQTAS
jgi:hypothetical protein